jgi:hypothetical protein
MMYIGCVPVDDGGFVIQGSVIRSCNDCTCRIWVAPSSFEIVAEMGATLLCIPCTDARIMLETIPVEFRSLPPTPAQLAEIEKERERRGL